MRFMMAESSLHQEFDSIEVAALNSWLNEHTAKSTIDPQVRGKPSTRVPVHVRLRKEREDREKTESAQEQRIRDISNRARRLVTQPRIASGRSGIKRTVSAGASRALQVAGPTGVGETVGIAAALGRIALSGPIAIAAAVATAYVAENLTFTDRAMEALAESRGRSAQALQNPFVNAAQGKGIDLSGGGWNTAVHFKDINSAILRSTFARTRAILRGNNLDLQKIHADQAFWSSIKMESPAIQRANNIERERFNNQLSRGEFEYGGWRKVPEVIGG